MKNFNEFYAQFKEATLERKCRLLSDRINLPVVVSAETWSGVEVRLTEIGRTEIFDAKHFRVNVSDEETLKKLILTFSGRMNSKLKKIVDDVCLDEKFDRLFGWMTAVDEPAVIFRRWKKFFDWCESTYDGFANDETFWDEEKGIPENMVAWAARCILGGIKPSRIGISAIKHGTAVIDKHGILTWSEKSNRVSVYDFPEDDGKYKSFGWSGALSADISKCFGDEKDKTYRVNKIPEQWEVDAGYFVRVDKKEK